MPTNKSKMDKENAQTSLEKVIKRASSLIETLPAISLSR